MTCYMEKSNDLASHIQIDAAGKSAAMNDDFDDLF